MIEVFRFSGLWLMAAFFALICVRVLEPLFIVMERRTEILNPKGGNLLFLCFIYIAGAMAAAFGGIPLVGAITNEKLAGAGISVADHLAFTPLLGMGFVGLVRSLIVHYDRMSPSTLMLWFAATVATIVFVFTRYPDTIKPSILIISKLTGGTDDSLSLVPFVFAIATPVIVVCTEVVSLIWRLLKW